MSIDDQARTRTFAPFFTAGGGPCKFALQGSEGNIKKVLRAIERGPTTDVGKHYFLVYLENNEFCFVEAEKLPSAEWHITAQSRFFSLERCSSEIAVCSYLRLDFENWWKERIGLTLQDLDVIRQLAPAPV